MPCERSAISKSDVAHDGGDNFVARQFAASFQIVRQHPKRCVTINELSRRIDEQSAIRIAIERHAKIGTFSNHTFLQAFDVKRAGIQIDVSSVRRVVDSDQIRTQATQDFGRDFGSGTVRAVNNDL